MEWWCALTADQKLGVVLPLASTLFGGAIALVTSMWIQNKASKVASKQKDEEKNKEDAAKALVVLYKVKSIVDEVYSLKLFIDRSYEQAEKDGFGYLEPAMKVKKITGTNFDTEVISTEGLIFLAHIGKPEFVREVLMVERKARSILLSAKEFTELTKSFEKFSLDNLVHDTTIESGAAITAIFTGKDLQKANAKVSELNDLLGQIEAGILEALPFITKTCSDLNSECRKYFGLSFPMFPFQWNEEGR